MQKPIKRRRFRLIPLTMLMLSLMLVIQVNELYSDSLKLRAFYGVQDAQAADDKPADAAAAANAPAADAKDKPADAAATTDKIDSKDTADADKPADATAPDTAEKPKDGKDKTPAEPKTYGTGKSTLKEIEALKAKEGGPQYSKNEVDLLENLSTRRAELDAREKDLELKEKVLDATQKRIDDKLAEMKTLDAQLSKVVAQYNEKQTAQIASLVKIYEAMKPVQAAAIFNELDLPILLEVIDKMSERKVAPVLALMDPRKARDVTQELAAMRHNNTKPLASAAKP